jgi:hypothetical protein
MATANEHLISSTSLLPVTPGATDLGDHKGIWVGGAGSVIVTLLDGSSVTIAGVNAGTLLPVRVKRITGGTATLMLLWA